MYEYAQKKHTATAWFQVTWIIPSVGDVGASLHDCDPRLNTGAI